jgi:hypothetical protein
MDNPMTTTNDNNPPPCADDDDTLLGGSPQAKALAAQRRREALQAFLHDRRLSAAELARMIGMANANLIYNLVHERSASLSVPVIERILGLFHDTSFEELVGLKPRPRPRPEIRKDTDWPSRNVPVAMEAVAGQWRQRVNMHPQRWELLPLPLRVPLAHPGAFGVLVGAPGAERAYPAGSLLVCRPCAQGEILEPGARVILHRRRDRLVETTVREVAISEGHTWLVTCSNKAEFQDALQLPASRGRKRPVTPSDFEIAGIVTWALVPEPGIRST